MGDAARVIVISESELTQLVKDAVRLALSEVPEPRMLTNAEAAARLGISEDALRKRVQRGYITPDIRGGREGAKGLENG